MALLWMDGFDHYGVGASGVAALLEGPYAATNNNTLGAPAWGSRTGPYAISGAQTSVALRKVLPATKTALLVGMGISVTNLPPDNNFYRIMTFNDGSNVRKFGVRIQSTGDIELWNEASSTMLGASQALAVVPANWHFLECVIDTVAGTFELQLDGNTVLNLASLTLSSVAIAQLELIQVDSGHTGMTFWMDDLNIRDTTGTYNNALQGDYRIAALYPVADGVNQGWTPQYRHKINAGILNSTLVDPPAAPQGIYLADNSAFNIGAADFTLETFVRFNQLPSTTDKAVIWSRWDETNNKRSYQLYLGGPSLEGGNLVFRSSTDGTSGTVVEHISWPWVPDTDTWYHLAVVRASGEDLLFINGIQQGLPIADAASYFAGGLFGLADQWEQGGNGVTAACFNGWFDESRFTNGYARYTSSFTPPTAAFPRNVGGDPQFAMVQFLAGYDGSISDESSYARAVSVVSPTLAETPTDGTAAYQTINKAAPQDDTFIEAPLVAASQILTLAGQPSNNDTVTVGTKAAATPAIYKFKTALTGASFEVLIDTTTILSLANLTSAINLTSGSGTKYGTGTTINLDVASAPLPGTEIQVTAVTPGTAGNSIASTSSLTNGASGWGGTTLAGGVNIPAPSDFFLQRPPLDTTLIAGIQLVTRSFKSDASAASVQAALVGPLGGVENGANNALTITPTYRSDIMETDPDTSAQITPSTIVGGMVRVNRTA